MDMVNLIFYQRLEHQCAIKWYMFLQWAAALSASSVRVPLTLANVNGFVLESDGMTDCFMK